MFDVFPVCFLFACVFCVFSCVFDVFPVCFLCVSCVFPVCFLCVFLCFILVVLHETDQIVAIIGFFVIFFPPQVPFVERKTAVPWNCVKIVGDEDDRPKS